VHTKPWKEYALTGQSTSDFSKYLFCSLLEFCANIKQTFYNSTIHTLQLRSVSFCHHYTIMFGTVHFNSQKNKIPITGVMQVKISEKLRKWE